ncbi:MAG TPA: Ku protein [Mesorhizobium sp.]|jgi:DNA end-binding protein Ku|nr:Ku protein [Mesorhizobium sp.]
MAARSSWKGYLKLSLVSCAVALYPATTSSGRVTFHTLNRKSGNRVKRQFVDAETGEVVDNDEQVKGYEIAKGVYVFVEDEELQAIKLESTHTIDIESFVPREQVDERYLDTPYYLAPEDKVAQEAFAVIREAMRRKDKAGVARIVMSNRERIVLLEPHGKGVLATVLRYPYEVKPSSAVFNDLPEVEVPKEMADLASHIIDQKAGDFEPDKFEDRYHEALLALVRSKRGEDAEADLPEVRPSGSNVINLMEALKKSIAAESKKEPATQAGKRIARKPSAKAGSNATKAKPALSAAKKTAAAPAKGAAGKAASSRTVNKSSALLRKVS